MTTNDEFRAQLDAVRSRLRADPPVAKPKPPKHQPRKRVPLETTGTTPYMMGRKAFTRSLGVATPAYFSAEDCREFRRGYDDARLWNLRRAGSYTRSALDRAVDQMHNILERLAKK